MVLNTSKTWSGADKLNRGISSPLGATVGPGGVNFSIFSRDCSSVELLLFDHIEAAHPSCIIKLDPAYNRTYHYWHVFVPGIMHGQLYGYRVTGPHEPERGLHFDSKKLLIDPYGRAVAVPSGYSRPAAAKPGDKTLHFTGKRAFDAVGGVLTRADLLVLGHASGLQPD